MTTAAEQRSWSRETKHADAREPSPDPARAPGPADPYQATAAPAMNPERDGTWIQSFMDRAEAAGNAVNGGITTQPADGSHPIPTMEEMERRLIQYALHVTRGSVPDAAGSLGISEATIYRKIKKYKLIRTRT